MYTLQQDGFLELELGDWKDNRMYRLLAVDHGMLSFIDVKHQQWPVVLITNPKDALFLMPRKENFEIVTESTHVRLLAFSPVPIKTVKIQIDNEAWVVCRHVEGPLYVAPWSPKMYKIGLHTIKAYVRDEDGRIKLHTQPFSLEGRKLSFEFLAKFVLMTNASTFVRISFSLFSTFIIACFSLSACFGLLTSWRYCH
uniref:TMEM62 Ig-like domain-containing protein n=2 Tax=Photinus pyralis TaxID=7054 RepID=A0A1Y1LQI4_PHOPY